MQFAIAAAIFATLCVGGASCASALKKKRQVDPQVQNSIIEVFNNCKCVFYYQCDENNNVITDGSTLINIRLNEDISRISCLGGSFQNEIVCCKLNNDTLPANRTIPVVKAPTILTGETDENDGSAEVPARKMLCGQPKTVINNRVFAEEPDITPLDGEFPWLAAIYENRGGTFKYHCIGSIIHPKVVLTANHCTGSMVENNLKVVVNGKITLSSIGHNADEESDVAELIRHPSYSSGNLRNDIALLILDKPFRSTKGNQINRICLPPDNVDLEGKRCWVAGWGKSKTIEENKVLNKVELPFVNHTKCQTLLRKTRLGERFRLHASFMCAGGEKDKDACRGDGGSPLMCSFPDDHTRLFQIGIVSWGVDCGHENVPGVYGNVQEMKGWIQSELSKRQIVID